MIALWDLFCDQCKRSIDCSLFRNGNPLVLIRQTRVEQRTFHKKLDWEIASFSILLYRNSTIFPLPFSQEHVEKKIKGCLLRKLTKTNPQHMEKQFYLIINKKIHYVQSYATNMIEMNLTSPLVQMSQNV